MVFCFFNLAMTGSRLYSDMEWRRWRCVLAFTACCWVDDGGLLSVRRLPRLLYGGCHTCCVAAVVRAADGRRTMTFQA